MVDGEASPGEQVTSEIQLSELEKQEQIENEKKLEKMWEVLAGTCEPFDKSEPSGSPLERDKAPNENDRDLTRAESLGDFEGKVKTPKKQKINERDKRVMAKISMLNKMLEKPVDKLKEKESPNAEIKANEVNLSKIKEEAVDASEQPKAPCSFVESNPKSDTNTTFNRNSKKING